MGKEHGISFSIARIGGNFFLKLKMIGRLTHNDYKMIVPAMESALVGIKDPKIKALIDAREFDGYEFRAAWDDLKFGLKHSKEFTKLAFVGNRCWEEYGVKISNWFMSGEMKYFERMSEAEAWLNQEDLEKVELTTIQKEFENRKDEIKSELKSLFESNMQITGWDVPEVDNQEVANILYKILEDGLDEIKDDIVKGKFD